MKAVKRGNLYRVLVYSHKDENGKTHYKSISDPDKKKCMQKALAYQDNVQRLSCGKLTFKEAAEKHLNDCEEASSLSVTTLRAYRSMLNHTEELDDILVADINRDTVQRFLNNLNKTKTPKTVRNYSALISLIMKSAIEDWHFEPKLPSKKIYEPLIPSDEEIKLLLSKCTSQSLYKGIILGAFGPMREGEVCAVTYEDIDDDIIHVSKSMARSSDGWIIKEPKTKSSDRYIPLGKEVIAALGSGTGRIVPITPAVLYKAFQELCVKNGLPQYTFHSLRHFGASYQHALGIPDSYIMQRGGWKTDSVLKKVYRHALPKESVEFNKKINDQLTKLI